MTEKEKKQYVDKDDLIQSAMAIEDIKPLIDELSEYFTENNPNDENGLYKIKYDFPRYRAFSDILLRLINDIRSDYAKLNIL